MGDFKTKSMEEIKGLIQEYKAEIVFARQMQEKYKGDNYMVDAYVVIEGQYSELVDKLSALKPNR